MAVPKKRTSKSKKNLRKTVWKKKALKQAVQAFYIADRIAKKETNEKLTNLQLNDQKEDS
uniref:Large ribosomal subunit protein bL32c n=1 Tax=Hazenia capsulata TaxID=2202518 RepID=A0A1W6EHI2_9CHLO|nr:ribosomal protein L32 [Hazenia capsulata]ARK14868.1 ribosomal protein L32 [Hazenia capsulata]